MEARKLEGSGIGQRWLGFQVSCAVNRNNEREKKVKEGGWASKGRDLKVERQEEIQRYYYDITFSQSLNVFLDTTYQVIL